MISGGIVKLRRILKNIILSVEKMQSANKTIKLQFENSNYAEMLTYVLGLLWNVKEVVGETLAPKFMQVLSTKLNSSSSVRNQLVKGIRETCEEICPNPSSQNLEILKIFAKKKM
jgi:anaerobic ribonucleoside-triphosphate reductase